MAAYLVVGIKHIFDEGAMAEYRKGVGATMEPYGAKFLAGAPAERKEGDWSATVTAIFEFPSMDALNQWYDSEAYRGLKQLRQRSAEMDLVFVEGA